MDVRDATAQLREMYPNAPSTDGSSIYTTDTGGGRRESMAPPPRPPMANPWDWNQRAPGVTPDDDAQSPGADRAESPVLPFASPSTPRMTAAQPPTLPGGERRVSAASTSSAASDYHYHHAMAMRPRHNTGLSNFSIPEDDVTQQQPSTPPASALPPIPTHKRAPTFRDSGIGSPISPTTPEVPVPDGHKPSYLPGFIQAGSTGDSEDAAVVPDSAQAPEVVPKDRLPQDDGLIPVETEPSALVHDMTEKEKEDAKILPDSSVTLAGGFCDGAKDVIRGGIGVKRVKKPVCPFRRGTRCQLHANLGHRPL